MVVPFIAPANRRPLLILPALLLNLVPGVRAQQPAASPTPALQVLQQQVVNVGTHRVILNRVAPPRPTPTLTTSAHTPAATNQAAAPEHVAHAATASAFSSTDPSAENAPVLALSATVYDAGRFTELRGSDAAGPWRAWSNVNFLLLAPVTEFGAGTTTCSLIMGLGTDTSDWLTLTNQYPAGLSSLPADKASYYFVDGATAAAHPETAAALDALHRYTDANRPALVQARQQREADQAAHEAQAEWARQHPTPTPDTVVNFWPEAGSSYLGR